VVEEVKTYRVLIERDPAGWWIASVPEVPGAHTQGRSIAQALNRTREALSLWVSDVERAELEPEIRLPAELRRLTVEVERARERERQVHEATRGMLLKALRALTDEDLSVRDAATLLGLSPARIQQVLDEARRKARPPARTAPKKKVS
jgi:predicted RNase H-like HicB family nuclease